MGLEAKTARKKGIHFFTDDGWTDPSAIRHVLEALRERDNPEYVPKPPGSCPLADPIREIQA
jgi:hypothetical protein